MPHTSQQQFQPIVLVLAAGRSSRFFQTGGRVNKLEALLLGEPVLQHVLRAVEAAGFRAHVVRSAHGDGMGDSIAAGVRATADADGWLVLPGDLPLIAPASIGAVAQALVASCNVVLPYCDEARGHPVGFPTQCFALLSNLAGERGADSVVRAWRAAGHVTNLPLDDPGIAIDVDTVADLARAEVLLRQRSP